MMRLCQSQKFLGLFQRCRNRFLDQKMFTLSNEFAGNFMVASGWCCDDRGIDLVDDALPIGVGVYREFFFDSGSRFGARVCHHNGLNLRNVLNETCVDAA